MVKSASIISTIKPGEGKLNSRNQGIPLKKRVRNARGLKFGKGKVEMLWGIHIKQGGRKRLICAVDSSKIEGDN